MKLTPRHCLVLYGKGVRQTHKSSFLPLVGELEGCSTNTTLAQRDTLSTCLDLFALNVSSDFAKILRTPFTNRSLPREEFPTLDSQTQLLTLFITTSSLHHFATFLKTVYCPLSINLIICGVQKHLKLYAVYYHFSLVSFRLLLL